MIVRISVRGEDGKYILANPGDWVASAFSQAIRTWGWQFVRLWMSRVCLQMAEHYSDDNMLADTWIDRYQKIREIK